VWALAVTPNARQLAIGADSQSPLFWDAAMMREESALQGRASERRPCIRALALDPRGNKLAYAGDGDTVALRDMTDPRPPIVWSTDAVDPVRPVALSPDGNTLAYTIERTAELVLWDVTNPKQAKQRATLKDCGPAAFSPDGKTLEGHRCACQVRVPRLGAGQEDHGRAALRPLREKAGHARSDADQRVS
jgi:hypothetical protein